MRVLTALELQHLQATQDGAMQDTGCIMAYGEVDDAWGNPETFYTAGAALACGFRPLTPREIQQAGLVPTIAGKLRLPVATVLDPRDRIRITKRYGTTLVPPQDYEVVGPVERGPSGIVVNLQAVTA